MKKKIEQHCEKYIETFKSKMEHLSWAPSGILMSEGFAFCTLCDFFKVDVIIESGIFHARSTQIWAEYFPDCKIFAIDTKVRRAAKARLSKYNNVTILKGNGSKKVLEIIKSNRDKKIGVFLDGPKGPEAVKVARRSLSHDNVLFVGIHDMHYLGRGNRKPGQEKDKSISRITFDDWNITKFLTDEKWFYEKYQWLDEDEMKHFESRWEIRWTPYQYVDKEEKPHRKLGSYGPTIGFAISPYA